MIIIGIAVAAGLPFSALNGVLFGLQRNDLLAAVIGGSKLVSALLLALVAIYSGNIKLMAIVSAIVSLATMVFQWISSHRAARTMRISWKFVSWSAGRELADQCFSLTIWSIGMLMVQGLDTVLVGYFDYEAVGSYAIAASLVTFMSGTHHAILSVLLPEAAVMQARKDQRGLGQLLVNSTRYGMLILFAVGIPLLMFSHEFITFWVGESYTTRAEGILRILLVACFIRSSLVPYAVLLVGTGQQKMLIFSPLAEGIINLLVSMMAAHKIGAIGVAWGTLIGVLALWFLCLFYNMPRTTEIPFQRLMYLQKGLLRPVIWAVLWAGGIAGIKYISHDIFLVIPAAVIMLGTIMIWLVGLNTSERQKVAAQFRRLRVRA